MDFRAEQRQARANTARLAVYFLLAILGTVGMIYLYGVLIWVILFAPNDLGFLGLLTPAMLWHPELLAWGGGGALGLIALGSAWKTLRLRAGGAAVARMLRCRAIDPATANLAERRLLNIVGEMAIASGLPVPRTWMLDEVGAINAFAAGYTPRDAVIGVTRGSLEFLSRDELQGVIAHEFSHIKNGDIRINMRLIGWLHGLLMIGYLGELFLRLGAFEFSEGTSAAQEKAFVQFIAGTRGVGLVWFIGLGGLGIMLLGIGCTGLIMAQRIRNAISRERELLADAAAVEFTRNKQGLAGALKKIGSQMQGLLSRPRPREKLLSHLFFSKVAATPGDEAGASHPDLRFRIWRLDPDWDGVFHLFRGRLTGADLLQLESPIAGAGGAEHPATTPGSDPAPLSDMEGCAVAVPANLPPQLLSLSERKEGPRWILYALLIDDRPEVRQKQLVELGKQDPRLIRPVQDALMLMGWLDNTQRMVLIDHLLPTFSRVKPREAQALHAGLAALVAAGGRTSLPQFYLLRCLERELAGRDAKVKKKKAEVADGPGGVAAREGLGEAFAMVLSTLAHADSAAPEAARRTFETMRQRLGLPAGAVALLPRESCKLPALDRAAEALRALPAAEKASIVATCHACLAADQRITLKESQLLRLVAVTMDAPMPAILPNVND